MFSFWRLSAGDCGDFLWRLPAATSCGDFLAFPLATWRGKDGKHKVILKYVKVEEDEVGFGFTDRMCSCTLHLWSIMYGWRYVETELKWGLTLLSAQADRLKELRERYKKSKNSGAGTVPDFVNKQNNEDAPEGGHFKKPSVFSDRMNRKRETLERIKVWLHTHSHQHPLSTQRQFQVNFR